MPNLHPNALKHRRAVQQATARRRTKHRDQDKDPSEQGNANQNAENPLLKNAILKKLGVNSRGQ